MGYIREVNDKAMIIGLIKVLINLKKIMLHKSKSRIMTHDLILVILNLSSILHLPRDFTIYYLYRLYYKIYNKSQVFVLLNRAIFTKKLR